MALAQVSDNMAVSQPALAAQVQAVISCVHKCLHYLQALLPRFLHSTPDLWAYCPWHDMHWPSARSTSLQYLQPCDLLGKGAGLAGIHRPTEHLEPYQFLLRMAV